MARIERVPDQDDNEPSEGMEATVSLEELGSLYHQAMDGFALENLPSNVASSHTSTADERNADHNGEFASGELNGTQPRTGSHLMDSTDDSEDEIVTEASVLTISPQSILESVLFVGHPSNHPMPAEKLASLMRGVQPDEIEGYVNELNASYRENHQAFWIVENSAGYRLELHPEMDQIRQRIVGRTKDTRLNQDAIDCLALVAYQPGIERRELEKQWKKEAGSVLGNLVRRDLLRLERRRDDDGQSTRCYFPTDRMLNLFGLETLDDLPQVEELE